MIRTDETWHRLREWTYGQAPSERLAAQVLQAEGFSGIDPSHPLGGPDGGRDGTAVRDGELWVFAVYFPRGRRPFGEVKQKLVGDAAAVLRHGATGIAFVTNQELTLGQRQELCAAVRAPVELLHLERIAAILDRPDMYGVREQYLKIPAPPPFAGDGAQVAPKRLEAELREMLAGENAHLSTRGVPRDLRQGEPRLPMKDVFVALRVAPPVAVETIGDALAGLSFRERRVLELRLALTGQRANSRAEVGRTFNVTAERISQIEARALGKVAKFLRASAAARVAHNFDLPAIAELVAGMRAGLPLFTAFRHRLVVLGAPGSGKSTVTRYLTWAAAREDESLPERLRKKLPFRVTCADFARALAGAPVGLFEFALERAGTYAPALRRAHGESRLLLIVDGLDEVTDPALAEEVSRQLNRFLRDRALADVATLFTSRVVGYHPEPPLAEIPTVSLAPLNLSEIERFLSGWFAQLDGVDAAPMTERLLVRLGRDARMAEFANTPLLLTVLALLQSRNERLPNERAQLYAAATETLMHSWPKEQRASSLSYDTIPRWLAPLARRAFLSPSERGVPEEEVVDILSASWQEQFGGSEGQARQQTRELLQALRDDAGLLSVTGHSREGARLWDFLHRTFAEYLVARERADAYLSRQVDPLTQIHDETWREVTLMTLGELGRRRLETVSPLLEGLCASYSTPWESSLRRDLRLALTALSHDVPCERSCATRVIDQALETWTDTAIAPLRRNLSALFTDLRDTRYTSLLAARARLLTLTREQRLELGSTLTDNDLLAPLLTEPDACADKAAVAMLETDPPGAATGYLRERLPEMASPMVIYAAEMLARHDRGSAIAELVRRVRLDDPPLHWFAAQVLARIKGRAALSSMETLLDLYPGQALEPLLERLGQGRAAARARLFELARKPGRARIGALSVLRGMRAPGVEEMLCELSHDDDFETRLLARELRGIEVTDLAVQALSDPTNPWHLWAAQTLIADAQHAPQARAALLEVAVTGGPLSRVSALGDLASTDPEFVFSALSELLAQTPDASLRRSIVELLGANESNGAEDALIAALANPEANVVAWAAEALLPSESQRRVAAIVGAAIEGDLDTQTAVALLGDLPEPAATGQAVELLASDDISARRLGARLLSRIDDARVGELAVELIDDADATVRCGAVWALVVTDAHKRSLLARIGRLLADEEPVLGPSLADDRPPIMIDPPPVRCCADAAYRLLEETPGLLEAALAAESSPPV